LVGTSCCSSGSAAALPYLRVMQLHFKQLGHGEPLVLLHGLFGSADNWFGVAPRLAKKFHVLIPDLRNHGHSPHHAEMDYPLMAADVEKFFVAQKIASAHVIGHSMGGKVAMQFALDFPARVKKTRRRGHGSARLRARARPYF